MANKRLYSTVSGNR